MCRAPGPGGGGGGGAGRVPFGGARGHWAPLAGPVRSVGCCHREGLIRGARGTRGGADAEGQRGVLGEARGTTVLLATNAVGGRQCVRGQRSASHAGAGGGGGRRGRAGDGAPRGPTPGPLQRNVFARPRSGEPAPDGPPLGPLMRPVQPPVRAGDQAPREPTLRPQRRCSLAPGGSCARWATAGARAEQGTWGSRTWKCSEAGCGRPEDGGVWTAKAVKRCPQQPAQPQYANYWAPLTRKRHTMPHPAQPRYTSHGAPRTRKRHQQEHRPQRPTESSDPTQHAKGRTGDCPGAL